MITAEIVQTAHDSIALIKKVAEQQVADAQQSADVYKYIASGLGTIILIFASYVLTSLSSTVKALKDSIVTLNIGVSKLSEELHLNRADEVANRGLQEMKHAVHTQAIVLVNTRIDGVETRVEDLESGAASIKNDFTTLKTEHKLFHKGT